MKLKIFTSVFGMLSASILVHAAALADEQTDSPPGISSAAPDTRYGLFNGLDHRSWYGEGDFPEPFLVDDSRLEINEARLDWLHTATGSQHNDTFTAEVEKGFGLLTLEIEVPYEYNSAPTGIAQGVGNIDLGARYPFYQYVSCAGFFDTTFGGAVEIGIPASSAISVNPEFVPKIFNDTKIGEHFTAQSIFGCSIQHRELPLPRVQQFIPMFELVGETPLNKDQSGQNSLLGNACVRLNLETIGRVQPRLGAGICLPVEQQCPDGGSWWRGHQSGV